MKVQLYGAPTTELHQELNRLQFTQSGYPDERLGPVDALDEVIRTARRHQNSVWKTTVASEGRDPNIIGDALSHARTYLPEAVGAVFNATPVLRSGDEVITLLGEFVSWVEVKLRVTC